MPGTILAAMLRLRVALTAAALLLAAASSLAAAAPAGTVVGVSGPSFVESDGARSPLALGQTVQVGDTVEVGDGAKLKLRMNDGSVLSIASGTRLTVAAYRLDPAGRRQDAQLALASGLLRAVVAATPQPARFEVNTATGVAAVRSTDWFVEATPNTTEVAVLDGAVVLSGRSPRRAVVVDRGLGARVDAGRDPLPPHAEPAAAFARLIAQTSLENRLGWCQCIANRKMIEASCRASAAACQAACGSPHFAFIPSAPFSCGGGSP